MGHLRGTAVVFLTVTAFWKWPGASGQVPGLGQPPVPAPSRSLAPCQACKVFAGSFRHGIERTERGKFEGGDAAWEEEKLGPYGRSEVRLVEIQEKLCSELSENRDRCHAVAELAETHLEEWWFNGDPRSDDVFLHVCIRGLKHCCPIHHFGENCEPCKGGTENPCNGNGRCRGDGTRKGNGECACDSGYTGEFCNRCDVAHYQSYKDDKKTLCSPCHRACRGGCSRGGVTGCTACNPGWTFHDRHGCVDVDECVRQRPCQRNQFCVNDEGTYKCLECDRSCDGCHGDGPDMCRKCASGFQFKDKMCVDSVNVRTTRTVTLTRYLTYLGLCITTCIIFQKSTVLAAVLGLLVALYISVAEYTLANDSAGYSPSIDPNEILKLISERS